jgi:hypothetical protein
MVSVIEAMLLITVHTINVPISTHKSEIARVTVLSCQSHQIALGTSLLMPDSAQGPLATPMGDTRSNACLVIVSQ